MVPWIHKVLQMSVNTTLSSLSFKIYFKALSLNYHFLYGLTQGSENFFCKGWWVNILGYVGHVVCVATIQLCCWNVKGGIDKCINESMWACYNKTSFTKIGSGQKFAKPWSNSFQWENKMLQTFSLWIFWMCSALIICIHS